MDKSIQKKYKREIQETKLQNIETLFLMLNYAILNVLQSASSYQKNKRVVSEFYAVVREETILLDFLKKNLDRIDTSEFYKTLDMLEEVNEKTKIYYYEYLGNIESNFDFFRKYYGLKKVTDTDEYRKKVFCTALSFDNVKEYLRCLNITEEAWEYIQKRTIVTEDEVFYGVNVKMNGDIVEDFRVFVPTVKNIETARINVHAFTHAYDIYKMIGKKYLEADYELKARNNEIAFKNIYVEQKVKQYFRQFDNMQQKN